MIHGKFILLLISLQETEIDRKLEEAPDNAYAIGVWIGTLLPFLLLVVAAYLIFRYQKRRMDEKDFD